MDLLKSLGLAVLLLVPVLFVGRRLRSTRPKSVAIIVLGDIGRSPRMLYHTQSFLSHGYTTYIVAYRGSTPPKEILESPHVRFVYLPTPLAFVSRLPKPLFLALSPFKVVLAAVSLFWALTIGIDLAPAYFLVQNPPAIPTLPVVKIAGVLRGSKLIVDWHNTGYSVLALRLGANHPIVKLARGIETFFGRVAHAHLCVTSAMKDALIKDADLNPSLSKFLPPTTKSKTPFTTSSSLRDDRPALLLSATSWTADEDFSVLLRALSLYDAAANSSRTLNPSNPLPKVLVVITGKGAGKADFEREVEVLEKSWKWVRVRTAWLAIGDYPKLLGSADLGISLHTSTSGADLPMKVVDMFGINELVVDGANGRVFKTAEQLSEQLVRYPVPTMEYYRDDVEADEALETLRSESQQDISNGTYMEDLVRHLLPVDWTAPNAGQNDWEATQEYSVWMKKFAYDATWLLHLASDRMLDLIEEERAK
ncbi:beta-1,4-mannosyltransferase, glycosyltransferase family 33 protein [Pseudohyphozyma bogoriensis]|nr:beta-1,4-mannosyltransferase, glycosyltransferase family 33 protein [Pseudohyphozyma bogoriensis]